MALNLNFPQGRIGRLGLISLVLFILTIPLGNWVVTNVGLVCDPHGPCLIPVWPGVWSPSAVMVAGLALVLRDAVQSILGNLWALAAIAAGADGLMIEVHNDPKNALCDGAQSLTPAQFDELMQDVKRRAAFEGKRMAR